MLSKTIFSISLVFVLLLGLPVGMSTALAGVSQPPSHAGLPESLRQAILAVAAHPFSSGSDEQKVTISDASADDLFGMSVALSGDTALVGAPGYEVGSQSNQGLVDVFTFNGSAWTVQQVLTASDGNEFDSFGEAVALSGDTALIASPTADVGGNTYQGVAYIFTRSGTTWSQQAKLVASDGSSGDFFGGSVSLSGDTALVGADNENISGNTYQGAAYIFTRSGTAWNQQAKLTASDGAANDFFGMSVALSDDTALVSAPDDNVGGNNQQGSAYVFVRSGSSWTQQAHLTGSDGNEDDWFGMSVALSTDTALVGASGHGVGENSDQGSAYIFTRSGSTWTQQAMLAASDGAAYDQFGYSAALYGDTALVGAILSDIGSTVDQGSAYTFIRSGTSWSQQAKLTSPDGAVNDHFGSSVALSSDTALVGAPRHDVGGNSDQGAAYFFRILQTFGDVHPDQWYFSWVERLYAAGITSGCSLSPLLYCPDDPVTRAQMAKFLEKGINGSVYTPPAGTGMVFVDVPLSYWADNWIENLYADGITSGCLTSPLSYCPDQTVTRDQMAKFLLKAKYGASYTPPGVGGSTGFADVAVDYWAAPWIKQLAAEGITSGCGGGNYCPGDPVTRAQMAKFLVLTFNLP